MDEPGSACFEDLSDALPGQRAPWDEEAVWIPETRPPSDVLHVCKHTKVQPFWGCAVPLSLELVAKCRYFYINIQRDPQIGRKSPTKNVLDTVSINWGTTID